jgi:hypothetical protein
MSDKDDNPGPRRSKRSTPTKETQLQVPRKNATAGKLPADQRKRAPDPAPNEDGCAKHQKKARANGNHQAPIANDQAKTNMNDSQNATASDQTDPFSAKSDKELEKERTEYLAEHKKEDANKTKPELQKTLFQVRKELFTVRMNHDHYKYAHDKVDDQRKKLVHKVDLLKAANKHLTAQLETINGELTEQDSQLKSIQDELVDEKEKRATLKKRFAALMREKAANDRAVYDRNGVMPAKNAELVKMIRGKTNSVLWGMVKFIQSPQEELNAAKLLIKYGEFPNEEVNTKEKRLNLAHTYMDDVKKFIFNKRSYVASETQKLVKAMWSSKETEALSLQELQMCLQRDINSNEQMERFLVYWEKYVSKFVGSLLWSETKNMYYTTISAGVRTDISHDLPLISSEDEAFGVLCIHNQMDRWRAEWEKEQSEGQKVKSNAHDGQFTSTRSGQNRYGGWSEEGLLQYNNYLNMNIAARKTDKVQNVEKDALNMLRDKYKITSDSHEEHLKLKARIKSMKKRGKTDQPAPTKQRVVLTMRHNADDSDDSEDEDDDEDEE